MAYTNEGEYPDPNSRGGLLPKVIDIKLRFELNKTHADNNQIEDSNPNNDRGLFNGAINIVYYKEFLDGEVIYEYTPENRLGLEAQKTPSGDIVYTILLPLSDDSQDPESQDPEKFPFDKYSEDTGQVRDLFDCIVDGTQIPGGQIDLATNNLAFIIDNQILAISGEIIKVDA